MDGRDARPEPGDHDLPDAVVRLCRELAKATAPEGMFTAVVDAIVAANVASGASVLMFDDGGAVRLRAARGLSGEYTTAVDGNVPWLRDTRGAAPLLVDDVATDPATLPLLPVLRTEGIGALAFLPLQGGGRLLGALVLHAERPRRWADRDLRLPAAAADLLASFLLREREHERLAQARRMESLGLMAGGIAHDFNNLLTSILGYVDLVKQETVRGTPARGFVDELLRAVDQASELTRRLLGFSRPHTDGVELLDLAAVVAEAQPTLQRLCGQGHEVHVTLGCERASVRANVTQLHQLLMNLVANARDAMPDGGRITVRVRTGSDPAIVELEVADSGVGMDEETKRRVFEPLFTTKSPRRGTGLGLATCYAIATSLGGDIAVRTSPGRGSSFVVALPIADRAAGDAAPPARPAALPRARDTVLLVEDQDHVVRMLQRALQVAGYRVLVAGDGKAALAVLAEEHVDLVVSDIVMPEMDGLELAEVLRRERPALPVLLVTGYVDGSQPLPPDVPVLLKPFLPRELTNRIAAMLAAAKGGHDAAAGG